MSFSILSDAKTFAFAGHALLTLESKKSGDHFTYRINECKNSPGLYFVSLLTDGSADEGTFTYLGIVREGKFSLTKKSAASAEAPSVRAFSFFMRLKELHPQLVVMHEGHCGKCGRTLTVPESIERGIGPECASRMAKMA